MIPALIAIAIGLVLVAAGSGIAYRGIASLSVGRSMMSIAVIRIVYALMLSSIVLVMSLVLVGDSERVILNTFGQYASNFALSMVLVAILAMAKVQFRLEFAVYAFFVMLFTFMPFLGHISFRECLILEIIVSVMVIVVMDIPHRARKEEVTGTPVDPKMPCLGLTASYALMFAGTALMVLASEDIVTGLGVDQYKILAAATVCISITMLSVPVAAMRNHDARTAVSLTATMLMFNTILVFLALELIPMVDFL